MNTATIFDIQRNSFVDGPGIRTTVFFKGCNLRCKWCHNPESQSTDPQIMFYKDKCVGCGRCKDINEGDSDFICFNSAKFVCGKKYATEEILNVILKDKAYYENSGGGVTFSGGECMLQVDFLADVLKKCKEKSIHTAVDTAGNVPWADFERIIPYTDLFLYDIKTMNDELHRKYTGVSNKQILSNAIRLFENGSNVMIRIPIIPGVNNNVADIKEIRKFLSPYRPSGIELLPYHKMGEHKYEGLSMYMPKFEVPTKHMINELQQIFEHKN